MQRGRLAAARGAAHQHQAVAFVHHGAQHLQVGGAQADVLQRYGLGAGQQAQHHVFQPVRGGHRDHAQLHRRAAKAGKVDLAVLGLAVLGNVQAGHDLDARHHGKAKPRGQLQVGRQLAIDAQADAHVLRRRFGLDVDVGGAVRNGLVDDGVDQPHQRVVRLADHIGLLGIALGQGAGEVAGQLLGAGALHGQRRQVACGPGGRARCAGRWLCAGVGAVGPGNGGQQGARRGLHRHQPPLGEKAQLIEQHAVQRVGHQHHQRVLARQQGQHGFALGHGARHQRQRGGVGGQLAGVHHVPAQPAANHLAQPLLRQVALGHQDLAHGAVLPTLTLLLLDLQAAQQRCRCDQPSLHQRLAQVVRIAHQGVRRIHQPPQAVCVFGVQAGGRRCVGGHQGVGHGKAAVEMAGGALAVGQSRLRV